MLHRVWWGGEEVLCRIWVLCWVWAAVLGLQVLRWVWVAMLGLRMLCNIWAPGCHSCAPTSLSHLSSAQQPGCGGRGLCSLVSEAAGGS